MPDSNLSNIDLLDLDRWEREGAPLQQFARLRELAPVWRHPSRTDDGQPGFWVVSGYDEVFGLSRCPHAMSSAGDLGGVVGLGPGDELQGVQDRFVEVTGGRSFTGDQAVLATLDPPEHTAYRSLVNRGFTPRAVRHLEDGVASIVGGLLDRHPAGVTYDFTTEVAMPVPMTVIADLLGAPPEMHADIVRLTNQAVGGTDPEYTDPEADFAELEATAALTALFDQIRQARLRERRDDLVSLLLDAEIDGERLSEERFFMFLVLLAIGGNETTRNAMSHAVWLFAQHPDQWERLREDPALVPTAVEEILRVASPALYMRRNAVEEMEVAGVTIRPGDIVSLWYVSANRDEQHFPDPDLFDIGRDPNPHVAFGGGGPHYCLGASLTRLELRVFLEQMIDRYRTITIDGPVERLRSNFLNGIKHIPARLT